ncbi:Metalloenzyme superfamily [Desulforamulus hydrothermalis Lam5 = DSM 18033]|nr:Metalloenzyme superfamily [Desulforamulus hydrothermalis Lam5 = DSM 18033]
MPFILVSQAHQKARLRPDGSLPDIAPTVLELLGLPQPPEMTGKSLLAEPQ